MRGAAEVTADVRERIAVELEGARARTTALLEPLSDDQLTQQVSPLMSPLVWDLAHIGHFEELWISRRLGGARPIYPDADDTYDAFAHEREERPSLELLDPRAARSYLDEVRARSLEVLEETELEPDDPLLRGGFAFGLVVQHEQQHVETMLQTIQLSGWEHEGGAPGTITGNMGDVAVEAGMFTMGGDDDWAYDNERPAHEAETGAYRIDIEPVSNGDYAAFLAEGGWPEPPLSWERNGEKWVRCRFGHVEPVPPDESVQHVSWEEADAYARWAGGKRLPTEAEWERAAKLGVLRGLGSVWEWTSSDFIAYPGFRAFPYAEYSEVFFGSEYKVLRGASWATSETVARMTFRNWDFPVRRQIFAGFRCAVTA